MEWFILAFLSAILSAFSAISQKNILFRMNPIDFSLLLSIVILLLSLALYPFISFDNLSALSLFILYIKTLFGAVAFLLIMFSIKNLEISAALPLMILTPAFVAIFAFIFLDEALTIFGIIGLIILLIGIFLLETVNSDNPLDSLHIFVKSKYKHYLLYAILLFTISTITDKYLLSDYHLQTLPFLFFQQIFLALNFLIIFLLKRKNLRILYKNINRGNIVWILLIAFLTIGYRFSLLEAMKIAPVALVLSIKRTSIFFATLIGGKIFSEKAIIRKSFSVILMFIGVYLIIIF